MKEIEEALEKFPFHKEDIEKEREILKQVIKAQVEWDHYVQVWKRFLGIRETVN